MHKKYLDLMEKVLSAYTDAHILRYFNDVKKDGLSEHGFPRLTANIGILIANGRRPDLVTTFCEMMEFCCKTIPTVKAANDFSVREIVCCIWELEKGNVVTPEDISRWKGYLATIEPENCYSKYAKTPTDSVRNWALFTGVSEFFRQRMGLCDSSKFIDIQIASQLQWLDKNGMYMDNPKEDIHQPIMYDLVPRGLFYLLLFAGYRGKYYEEIDSILKRTGLMTLNMQSVTGEVAFGGRSNQFLHNEAWLALIFEYEARRYKKEGDYVLAGKFKAAVLQALKPMETWLEKSPITHIKNRFPIHSQYGCEGYAYFDKYMITAASFLYAASLMCDNSITACEFDESPMIWSTSEYFHKTFVRAGGYSLEFDTNADPHYDASGLGRIHKQGAPSMVCISMPFSKEPNYMLNDFENKSSFSICPTVKGENGEWLYGSESNVSYTLTDSEHDEENSSVAFDCVFENEKKAKFFCLVDKNGVVVKAEGESDQEMGICLPIFTFDGENNTKITEEDGKIFVEYDGWICEYETENLAYLHTDYANRNGFYKGYMASGKGIVSVRIRIYPLQ